MKINFILSDTTKSATTEAIKQVVKTAESNILENNIIIVPETKSIIIEKEILDLSKNGAFLNVFVYSFVRLLDRLGNVPNDKIVSKQTCVILLRKIILENEDKLECYKKSAKMVGFAEKIYETIAQFKSSGVTIDDLKLTLSTNKSSLKAKLKDIIFLYEEYEKALSDKLYDDCDKLSLISTFATNNEFLKKSNVFVIGFDNITFEMQTVLRDVAKNSKEITFSCVYFNEKRNDNYIQTNELYKKFSHIADSLKYPYIPRFSNSYKRGDIRKIQYGLFDSDVKKSLSNKDILVFEAGSDKQEIDFVANTILREVSEGKRFKDIGVLALNLEEKLEIIEECFKTYNIPYFANVQRKIDEHFVVKFIENAFDLYISHLSREKVLEFISNPIFDCKNYSLFENYIYEQGINYNEFLNDVDEDFKNKYLNKFEFNDVSKNEKICKLQEEIDEIKLILLKFREFYTTFAENIKASKCVTDFILQVNFVIRYFSIDTRLSSIIEFERQNNYEIQAEITSIILEKIKNFGNQLCNFLGQTNVSVSDFLNIYKTGFSTCRVNLSPVSIDCVIIQENTDGFYKIKDMFLVGAVEGAFPTKIQDSGIILDSELEEAKIQMGKVIEPAVKDINRREKYIAYEALIEPSEKLFISYSLKSVKGKASRPARIVTDLTKLFSDDIVTKKYNRFKFVNYEVLESQFVNQINKFKNGIASLDGNYGVNYFYTLLGDHISERLKNYIIEDSKEREFNILNAEEIYFFNGKSSASQFQTYFDCPYKFFANYGLKLKENKDSKLSVPDVGTIIHRVAELFARKFNAYKNFNEDNLEKIVRELLNIALEENHIKLNKNKSLVELIFGESLRLCKYLIFEQENSSFKIDRVEYGFNNDNSINLKLSNGNTISIIGKIDRIDKFGDYIRVIDYKTGNITSDLKSIYYGKKIQLAIYLQAVQNISGVKVAGIFYFPIHSEYSKDERKSQEIYKMEGFLLNDIDVVKNMDHTISENNLKSFFVPLSVKFNKTTGEISFNEISKHRYSEREFEYINNYVKNLCLIASEEILSGFNEPSPIADNNSETPLSCKSCELYGFCGLEKSKFKFGRNFSKQVNEGSFYPKENDDETRE